MNAAGKAGHTTRLSSGRILGLDPTMDAITLAQVAALAEGWIRNPASRPPEMQQKGVEVELLDMIAGIARYQAILGRLAN